MDKNLDGKRLRITPAINYNIEVKIFKGNNWTLTFLKRDGFMDSDTFYRIKLNIDGEEFGTKGYGVEEGVYTKMLEEFTAGRWSIDEIKKILASIAALVHLGKSLE